MKFMKKTDLSVYIFIPAAGAYYGDLHAHVGERCFFQSSTLNEIHYEDFGQVEIFVNNCYFLVAEPDEIAVYGSHDRCVGLTVRPVYNE